MPCRQDGRADWDVLGKGVSEGARFEPRPVWGAVSPRRGRWASRPEHEGGFEKQRSCALKLLGAWWHGVLQAE